MSDRVGVKEKPRGGQWVWRLVLYKEIENISTYTEDNGSQALTMGQAVRNMRRGKGECYLLLLLAELIPG